MMNWLTKRVYYKLVKTTIDTVDQAKIMIDVLIGRPGVPELIICDWSSWFISKFLFLLCYFTAIKLKLSTAFYLYTYSMIERQNSIIKTYWCDLVNWEENNEAKLLPISEFGYHNAQYISSSYTAFKLNYSYYLYIFFENEFDSDSKSCFFKELKKELQEMISICQPNLFYVQQL